MKKRSRDTQPDLSEHVKFPRHKGLFLVIRQELPQTLPRDFAFPLAGEEGRAKIGRGDDNDLIFSDDYVSCNHARLTWDAKTGVTIEDLGSKNGTSMTGGMRLSPGNPVGILVGYTIIFSSRTRATLERDPLASIPLYTHPIAATQQ